MTFAAVTVAIVVVVVVAAPKVVNSFLNTKCHHRHAHLITIFFSHLPCNSMPVVVRHFFHLLFIFNLNNTLVTI